MGKLSKAQIEVLRRLAEPGNFASYMRHIGSFQPNAYWFYHHGRGKVREKTMWRLLNDKLVSHKYDSTGNPDVAHITSRGRAALAEIDKEGSK